MVSMLTNSTSGFRPWYRNIAQPQLSWTWPNSAPACISLFLSDVLSKVYFFVCFQMFWRITFWVLFKPYRLQHEVHYVNLKFLTPFIQMDQFCFIRIAWILLENAVWFVLKILKKFEDGPTTNRRIEKPSPSSDLSSLTKTRKCPYLSCFSSKWKNKTSLFFQTFKVKVVTQGLCVDPW